jgi:hypothetical protein
VYLWDIGYLIDALRVDARAREARGVEEPVSTYIHAYIVYDIVCIYLITMYLIDALRVDARAREARGVEEPVQPMRELHRARRLVQQEGLCAQHQLGGG